MIKVSIVIPIHNRLEVTKDGLKELKSSLNNYYLSGDVTCNYDVIVVDDGSTDQSGTWIKEHYPDVLLLKGDGNLWWSGAINVGARYAIDTLNSDYIVLWNNDIIPQNDFFSILEKELLKNKNHDILGSIILDFKTEAIWANGGFFNRYTGKRYVGKKIGEEKNGSRLDVDWLPGMGTVVPTEIIQEIDFWDNHNFPQYHGDIDFCLRAKEKGSKVYVCKDLIIKNKTEFSSYLGKDLRGFLKSLVMIQSRYCITKEIKFFYRHTNTPLWVYYFFRKYLGYVYSIISQKLILR